MTTEQELFSRWSPAELRGIATRALASCCDECRHLLRQQLDEEQRRD